MRRQQWPKRRRGDANHAVVPPHCTPALPCPPLPSLAPAPEPAAPRPPCPNPAPAPPPPLPRTCARDSSTSSEATVAAEAEAALPPRARACTPARMDRRRKSDSAWQGIRSGNHWKCGMGQNNRNVSPVLLSLSHLRRLLYPPPSHQVEGPVLCTGRRHPPRLAVTSLIAVAPPPLPPPPTR